MRKTEQIVAEFKTRIAAIPDKKKKITETIDFTIVYGDTLGEIIVNFVEDAIKLAKEINFIEGEIIGYFNLYFTQAVTQGQVKSKYTHSIDELTQMLEQIKHSQEHYSLCLNFLSYFHWFKGEYEKGFDLAFEGVRYSQNNTTSNTGWHYFALGVYYFDTKDLDNSKVYYQKAYDEFTGAENEYGKARSSNGLGTIAVLQKRTEDALSLLKAASDIYRELGHAAGLSRALNDMGLLEKANGNYSRAIELLNESIILRKELNHVQGLITSYTELGEVHLLLKNNLTALTELEKGLELARKAKSEQKQIRLHKLLYDMYKELNDLEPALKNFEAFYELKSKLLSDESSNNIKKIQTKFEKEKSEKEAEFEKQKNIELKKANTIIEQKNETLNLQYAEIASQRDKIEIQKQIIEDHQKEMVDSITYAKRIQDAILPPTVLIKEKLPATFVLYKPKDIVAGDFYWMESSIKNSYAEEETILIAAADCTGHGVPGAMVSIVCSNALNRAVKEFDLTDTGAILDKVTDLVIETFEKSATEVKDGMDISLLSINKVSKQIRWSGANNPLWYFENGELKEITADKQPIGKSDHRNKFTTHSIEYKKNTTFYLFTDGYADQFGGPKGKKLKYKPFQQMLTSILNKTPYEQQSYLDIAFDEWRGELEQVDDVCIIGITI